MINVSNTYLDQIPGEDFFTKSLQTPITFNLGSKTLRKGRLIIFKRSHFFIQVSLLSSKNSIETFEIPIPFKTEYYPEENLIYFDYRLNAFTDYDEDIQDTIRYQVSKNTPSQYLNKILEIQTTLA